MKDLLAAKFPEAWTAWAEADGTRLVGIGLLVCLNLYLCVRIGLSPKFERKQKWFWLFILWFFPLVGHGLLLQLWWQRRQAQCLQSSKRIP